MITIKCNSRGLIGLAAMVYQPLNHTGEVATIKLCSGCSLQSEISKIKQYLLVVFDKMIIPLSLVRWYNKSQLGATRLVGYLSSRIKRAFVEKLLNNFDSLG